MQTHGREVKLEFEQQPVVLDPISRKKVREYDEPFSRIDHVERILANQVVQQFVGAALSEMVLHGHIIVDFRKTYVGKPSDIGDNWNFDFRKPNFVAFDHNFWIHVFDIDGEQPVKRLVSRSLWG